MPPGPLCCPVPDNKPAPVPLLEQQTGAQAPCVYYPKMKMKMKMKSLILLPRLLLPLLPGLLGFCYHLCCPL